MIAPRSGVDTRLFGTYNRHLSKGQGRIELEVVQRIIQVSMCLWNTALCSCNVRGDIPFGRTLEYDTDVARE